jgi:hypothetical protein
MRRARGGVARASPFWDTAIPGGRSRRGGAARGEAAQRGVLARAGPGPADRARRDDEASGRAVRVRAEPVSLERSARPAPVLRCPASLPRGQRGKRRRPRATWFSACLRVYTCHCAAQRCAPVFFAKLMVRDQKFRTQMMSKPRCVPLSVGVE